MAHGENAERREKEYWKSRLHRWGEIPGRFTKKLTHKKERRESKEVIKEEIKLDQE